MGWTIALVGVACAALLEFSLADAQSLPSTAEFQKFILDQHNDLRSKEGGANMNELVWDSQLESEATEWAGRCVFKHQHKERGENLAYNTDMDWKVTTSGAMSAWFAEKKDYRNFGSSCSQGNACHYTQLVWADTRRVGCSLKKCSPLGNTGTSMAALYIVCFYDPRGNWEWDADHPYMRGAPCSKCQSDQTCKNNLCSGGEAPCFDKEDESKCAMWANDMNQCTTNPKFMEMKCKKSCGLCKGGTGKPNPGGDGETPDKAEACKDDNDRCETWANNNQCNSNPGYMKLNCKKSCGVCTPEEGGHLKPEPGPACRDGRRRCAMWAKRGECQANPGYMLTNCKKSCRVCTPEEGGHLKPEPGPACRDARRRCAMWAKRGECQANPGYMLTNCKKSCRVCTAEEGGHLKPEPGPACRDGRRRCAMWAKRGECQANPGYMLTNCKKSCRAC